MLTEWYECLLQLMRMEFVSWERSISLCPTESQQGSNAAWRLLAGRQTASSQSRQKTVKSTASVMTPYIQFYSFWAYCLLKQYLVRSRYSGIPVMPTHTNTHKFWANVTLPIPYIGKLEKWKTAPVKLGDSSKQVSLQKRQICTSLQPNYLRQICHDL